MNENPLDPGVLLLGLIIAILNALAGGLLPLFNDFFNLSVPSVAIGTANLL